jgi:hypothetical protein
MDTTKRKKQPRSLQAAERAISGSGLLLPTGESLQQWIEGLEGKQRKLFLALLLVNCERAGIRLPEDLEEAEQEQATKEKLGLLIVATAAGIKAGLYYRPGSPISYLRLLLKLLLGAFLLQPKGVSWKRNNG